MVTMFRFPLLAALLVAAPLTINAQPASSDAARSASTSSAAPSAKPASSEKRKRFSLPRPHFVRWSQRESALSRRDVHGSSGASVNLKSTAPSNGKSKAAPTAKSNTPKPRKRSANEPMSLVDRRLRLLVSQQEAWYADHARYGGNVSGVARKDVVNDAGMDKVDVQVLYASTRGWTAVAAHPDAPGKTCVVFVGHRERIPLIPRTRADANVAADEGRPVCDK
jgi:hypothetical protein